MSDIAGEGVRFQHSRKWLALLVVLVVLLAAGCGYWFIQYRVALSRQPKSDPERIAAITKQVSSVLSLPDETPTIATIVDAQKLTDAQLSSVAKNGDELLVYPRAERVLLYRPANRKVIDMFRVESVKDAPSMNQ
jgi:hypothetical protein